jgi:hypothetical protein
MVAHVNEENAAMVADAMAPAGKTSGLAIVGFTKLAAGVRAITMHVRSGQKVNSVRAPRPHLVARAYRKKRPGGSSRRGIQRNSIAGGANGAYATKPGAPFQGEKQQKTAGVARRFSQALI